MTVIDVDDRESAAPEALAAAATAPARWLLEMASADGVPLTQTNALARAIVREIAQRWPDWVERRTVSARRTERWTCPCSKSCAKG